MPQMKNLFKVLRYAIPYWGFASLNIIFNIISVVFSLVSFAAGGSKGVTVTVIGMPVSEHP
jgi:hypothetical protein